MLIWVNINDHRLPYRNFVKPGVRFLKQTITAIDPDANFCSLGGDSVLAAPLAIDAARLLDRAARAGAVGPQEQLSLFFKNPIVDGVPEHDLFRQRSVLERWVEATERSRA